MRKSSSEVEVDDDAPHVVSETGPSTSSAHSPTSPSSPSTGKHGAFGRIKVVIRCRPLTSSELSSHTCQRLHIHNNTVSINDASSNADARSFRFDRVLDTSSNQLHTFAEVSPLIDHVLRGFHATVFAYGQTGSGKTYTMEGLNYLASRHANSGGVVPDPDTPAEQHGVVLRTIQLIFDRAREMEEESAEREDEVDATTSNNNNNNNNTDNTHKDAVQYTFKCSFYQIYNERITDLLCSSATTGQASRTSRTTNNDEGLRLRWHKGDTFRVENLFMCECSSPSQMRDAFMSGVKEKVVRGHLLNRQSSRSHCIFTIYVECRSSRKNNLLSSSEFSLVDLAGSEKLGQLAVDPSAELRKESIDINTSLLALGKVIMALASSSNTQKAGRRSGTATANTGHVPYRDSKLTKLLKHALGGNSLTTMFACISPADRFVDESMSTLLYAGRAKNIENVPQVNEDATAALIRQLREEIQQLKQELHYYRLLATKAVSDTEAGATATNKPTISSAAANNNNKEDGVVVVRPSSSDVAEAAPASTQTDHLADSLISACELLKKIMEVNGQLRGAYDAVVDAKERAEQREVQLNAENIALRDRIEMLESIVLNDEFMTAVKHHPHAATELMDEPPRTDEEAASGRKRSSSNKKKHTRQDDEVEKRVVVMDAEEEEVVRGGSLHRHHRDGSRSRHASSSSSKHKHHKNRKKLARRLEEYESRYKAPSKTAQTYAEYYGRAQAKVPQHIAANHAIAEMEATLKKLPQKFVADFVPASLTAHGKFGALDFCGTKQDVSDFEEKRKEREARREALLRRQQELYTTVQKDVRDNRAMANELHAAQSQAPEAPASPLYASPYMATRPGSERVASSSSTMEMGSSSYNNNNTRVGGVMQSYRLPRSEQPNSASMPSHSSVDASSRSESGSRGGLRAERQAEGGWMGGRQTSSTHAVPIISDPRRSTSTRVPSSSSQHQYNITSTSASTASPYSTTATGQTTTTTTTHMDRLMQYLEKDKGRR